MPFYDVNSSVYLVTFFVFALTETLLCSGITYGWASIVVVFKMEYFYMNLCKDWYKHHNQTFPTPAPEFQSFYKNRSIVGGGAGYYNNGELPGCPIQDARLNLIFTVSLFCLCGIKFPAGLFIDWGGPRIARMVGGAMYVAASLGLGFVAIGYENFLFPVFACISMGGSLLVVSVYQVSNIVFRKSRSRVMCILHGAFDSSAVFLLVFKLIYENGIPFRYIMYGYSSICLILIVLGTFILIPPIHVLFRWVDEEIEMTNRMQPVGPAVGPDFVVRSYPNYSDFMIYSVQYGSCEKNETKEEIGLKRRQPIEYNPMDSDDDDDDIRNAGDKNYNLTNKDNEVLIKSMHKSSRFPRGSVLRSIFSALYLLELLYLITFQLKLWYFVGSLPDFLERIAKNKENAVSEYVNLFGYIQFGGILVTPIIGFVFERDNMTDEQRIMLTPAEHRLKKLRSCILPFAITNILGIAFCVVSAIEDLRAQVVSYVLYTTVRGFLYANHGSYMGIAFPASQFGTLYGLGIFIGGCFGVLQYALFEFTSNVLHGDPFWTNGFLLCLAIVGSAHPIYLWWYCRQEEKGLAKQRFRTTKTYTDE